MFLANLKTLDEPVCGTEYAALGVCRSKMKTPKSREIDPLYTLLEPLKTPVITFILALTRNPRKASIVTPGPLKSSIIASWTLNHFLLDSTAVGGKSEPLDILL